MAEQRSRNKWSRRGFLQRAAMGWASVHALGLMPSARLQASDKPKLDFPLFDLHVHPSNRLSIARAGEIARTRKMLFGMVEHVGGYYRIKTNDHLKQYIAAVRRAGMVVGLQPTFPNWRKLFDKNLLKQVDYILMDALALPNPDGSLWRIWRDDTKVDDKKAFMDRYLDFHLQIINTENIDILAAPTYLPPCVRSDDAELWNEKRMRTVIDAAVKKKVALEITQYYQRPTARFVRMAKAAGAKFTFGTNSRTEQGVGAIPYCIKLARQCGLTAKDIWLPKSRPPRIQPRDT